MSDQVLSALEHFFLRWQRDGAVWLHLVDLDAACGRGSNAALLADRLLGLRAADAFSKAEPAPERSPSFFGAVHIDASGRRWQELKLQSLSQTAKFLSIRA